MVTHSGTAGTRAGYPMSNDIKQFTCVVVGITLLVLTKNIVFAVGTAFGLGCVLDLKP